MKIPDSLAFTTAACLMCAGISIYGAIKRAKVPAGGSVGIVGIGGLGHIGTQIAKAMVRSILRFPYIACAGANPPRDTKLLQSTSNRMPWTLSRPMT